jgi:hypothetical protein
MEITPHAFLVAEAEYRVLGLPVPAYVTRSSLTHAPAAVASASVPQPRRLPAAAPAGPTVAAKGDLALD